MSSSNWSQGNDDGKRPGTLCIREAQVADRLVGLVWEYRNVVFRVLGSPNHEP